MEARLHAARVEREDEALRLRLHARRAAVVEDAQARAAGVLAGVVLPGEQGAAAHGEVAPAAAQPPDHLAAVPVELVDRPGVAGGDEQVAVGGDVDRVAVEVVEAGADAGVRLLDGDVVEAVPLEQDPAAGKLELLDDPADDRSAPRAARAAKIGRHDLVRGDERGSFRRQQELVHVGRTTVARREPRDDAVRPVDDHVRPIGETVPALALPPRQHRLSAIQADPQVHRTGRDGRMEPDGLAAAVDDQTAALARPRRRREEEEPGRGRAAVAQHTDGGGLQIRPRVEAVHERGPACCGRSIDPERGEPPGVAREHEAGSACCRTAEELGSRRSARADLTAAHRRILRRTPALAIRGRSSACSFDRRPGPSDGLGSHFRSDRPSRAWSKKPTTRRS